MAARLKIVKNFLLTQKGKRDEESGNADDVHINTVSIWRTDRYRFSGGADDEDVVMGYIIGYIAVFMFCLGYIVGYITHG